MASKHSDAQSTHKPNEPASDSSSANIPLKADMSPASNNSSTNRPPKADMSPASYTSSTNKLPKADISPASSTNRPPKAEISPSSNTFSTNRPPKADISPASNNASTNRPPKANISPASGISSADRLPKADISPVSGESTSCLISPPNISIGHMYVYNIGPDVTPTVMGPLKKAVKFQSPAASSGPICRICHEGDGREDLVSPCRCTGSVGLVHRSCMERWLSTRCSENDRCEICNYSFSTIRRPKSVIDYLKSDHVRGERRRSMLGDLTCFLLLTPLAGVSSFLCVEGAKRQVIWGNSLEAGCLMALATFLFTIYTVWNMLTFRYHLKGFLKWRSRNHNVKLIRVQRRSASLGEDDLGLPQNTPQPPNNSSGAQMTAVTITSENGISNRRSPQAYNSISHNTKSEAKKNWAHHCIMTVIFYISILLNVSWIMDRVN